MGLDKLDTAIEAWEKRMAERTDHTPSCAHEWSTAYKSASGRRLCVKCGYVTDAPFDALGVAERAK